MDLLLPLLAFLSVEFTITFSEELSECNTLIIIMLFFFLIIIIVTHFVIKTSYLKENKTRIIIIPTQ